MCDDQKVVRINTYGTTYIHVPSRFPPEIFALWPVLFEAFTAKQSANDESLVLVVLSNNAVIELFMMHFNGVGDVSLRFSPIAIAIPIMAIFGQLSLVFSFLDKSGNSDSPRINSIISYSFVSACHDSRWKIHSSAMIALVTER
jgi:hypothetical protein